MSDAPLFGSVINGKYKVGNRIGGGSFGEIYECIDLIDQKKVSWSTIATVNEASGCYASRSCFCH
jgi:hypothetical protein